MNTSQPSFLSKEAVFIRFAKLNNETVKWIGTSLLCIWAFLLQASFSHSHSDKCIRSNLRFSILPKDISTTIHEVWKSFRFNYAKLKWLPRDFHWLSNHTVSTWRIDFWGTLPLSIWDGTKNKIKNDKRTKSQQALDGHSWMSCDHFFNQAQGPKKASWMPGESLEDLGASAWRLICHLNQVMRLAAGGDKRGNKVRRLHL